ncbi:MAG: biotin--[acetyl-CoA-carboxylase] ligase [Pseudomonadota bacterium]
MQDIINEKRHAIAGCAGWNHIALGTVGSTNTLALELARHGDLGQVWITAEEQTAGKARRGRDWVSKPGNLFASCLLIDPAPADRLGTLPLVVSLALFKAVGAVAPHLAQDMSIKWPNDVLLRGAKLSGILLEATSTPQGAAAVVIGCGVNCAHAPQQALYKTTSLLQEGASVPPMTLFNQLARCLADELDIWNRGVNFSAVRAQWLAAASGLGSPVIVRLPDTELTGVFHDLDEEGYLLLKDENTGAIQRISAADIFFARDDQLGA